MSHWLKVEFTTPDKPEIVAAARLCGTSREAAFLAFFRLWAYFDTHCADGYIHNLTLEDLDDFAMLKGFGQAMAQVGWISADTQGISIANWDRHNGESAKKRAQTMRRVQSHRAKKRWDPKR